MMNIARILLLVIVWLFIMIITFKELASNNKFVLENKEKLSKTFDEKYQELEPFKMKMVYAGLLIIICIIASFIIKQKYFTYISLGISGVIFAVSIYKYNEKEDEKYNEIVKEVIHDFDSDLDYQPHSGFIQHEYSLCRFPKTCDLFYSEDMIINEKKGFRYADITVQSEHRDKDGDSYYVTEYEGSLAKMDIKNVGCKIFLGGMKIGLFFDKNDYKSIKFENDEFNSLFRAYSDNELQAYKILTPDIMEEFVYIKKNSFGDIDIRILDNKLYIRFLSGNGFDSSAFSKEKDKEGLCQSIAVLEDVMNTMEKVKKIIEKKDIS